MSILILLSLLSFTPGSSQAAIYVCKSASGGSQFQDRPCAIDAPAPAAAVSKMPLGIHESWFDKPLKTSGRAYCDSRLCECGTSERPHGGSLAQAVVDALYMDADWHHFHDLHQKWTALSPSSRAWHLTYREMELASCSILMSQQTLIQFGDRVEKQLSQRALQAEARGFDEPGPCDRQVDQACQLYADLLLYTQLKRDARALNIPRTE